MSLFFASFAVAGSDGTGFAPGPDAETDAGLEVVMDIEERLARELTDAIERLRQLGWTTVLEEAIVGGDDGGVGADGMDEIQLSIDREIGFATRSLLVERANRLANALDRVRDGRYGICDLCGETIAPARLEALPEVTTCVRCQDRLERADAQNRRPGPGQAAFGEADGAE